MKNRPFFNWFARMGEKFLKWQRVIVLFVLLVFVSIFAISFRDNRDYTGFVVSMVILAGLSAYTGYKIAEIEKKNKKS